MRKIVLATDGSEGANRATDVAGTLARATGARILVVTVGGNVSAEEVKRLAKAEGSISDALELIHNQTLHLAAQRLKNAGVSDVRTHFGWGDPAEIIINTAKREKADAIILGRRGRGRLSGLLLGSVSQKVISLAPCTAIIVP